MNETNDKFYIFFCNGGMPSQQKLGPFLQNRGDQKLKLSKNITSKSCSPTPKFMQENNLEKSLSQNILKICFGHLDFKSLTSLVTFRQKLSQFCIPNIDTQQPKSCLSIVSRAV